MEPVGIAFGAMLNHTIGVLLKVKPYRYFKARRECIIMLAHGYVASTTIVGKRKWYWERHGIMKNALNPSKATLDMHERCRRYLRLPD